MSPSCAIVKKLEISGFRKLRGRIYARIKNDILIWLELPTGKKLINLWYGVYPMVDSEIDIRSYTLGLGGWLPTDDSRAIDARKSEERASVEELDRLIEEEFLPEIKGFVSPRACLRAIPKMSTETFSSSLPYWLLLAREDEKAKSYFIAITTDENHLYHSPQPEGVAAEEICRAFSNPTKAVSKIESILDRNREDNIRKLKLKKLVVSM